MVNSFFRKRGSSPPPKVKESRQSRQQAHVKPRTRAERMNEAGGEGDSCQGSPEEGRAHLPAGRIPMCCWPSSTKLPMGWPSGLYAAPWLTEGSRRKPDCSHSRTQRRKKKRYTKQSAIVPAAALKRYSNNVVGAFTRGGGEGGGNGVVCLCGSRAELRSVAGFKKVLGDRLHPPV